MRPRRSCSLLLVASLAWLVGLAACGGDSSTTGDRPLAVVVIVVDTLRADQLAAGGSEGALTPSLSALAADGALFGQALAVSPWTGPSVCSILTGKYPDEIGIHDLLDPLPASVPTLATRLAGRGYATAAVVSNAYAGPTYGHDKGYETFVFERYKAAAEDGRKRPVFTADRVTDEALSCLQQLESQAQPYFLYVHYTDPHEPYLPPARWLDAQLEARDALPEDLLLERAFVTASLTAEQLEALRAQYQAEIAFTDHEIGRLLDALPDETLVVVTGDHGEEFREHGGFLHGHTLFQELLHVPLVLRGPGVPSGIVSDTPVSQVDIVPTLLELTGLATLEGDAVGTWGGLSGRSLTPLFSEPGRETDRAREAVPLFAVLENTAMKTEVVRQGPWKLISRGQARDALLFDLSQDPGETTNVAAQHRKIVRALQGLLKERTRRIVHGGVELDPSSPAERADELRAIGYLK